MIRTEEIYFNIFKKYVDSHIPKTRVFFCDPPGATAPENLMNYGNDTIEYNYVFLHDQEPVDVSLHSDLFRSIQIRNDDLYDKYFNFLPGENQYFFEIIDHGKLRKNGALIHSEYNSEFVEEACKIHNWDNYYYFFHGWAAIEWFRGFNYSFVIEPPESRNIDSSFICPNRIIGGQRNHRVLLFYNILKNKINTAKISMPKTCPHESIAIQDIGKKYIQKYPDIIDTLDSAELPWNFDGESGHPMESYTLGLYDECFSSLAYIVTETVFSGRRNHLTEKIFKPICLQMPFILLSTAHSLEYLRSYGFLTFSEFWNEDYDHETDDFKRIEKIAKLSSELDQLSPKELTQMYKHMIPIVKHNYNHFYNGNFKDILWNEMSSMLKKLKKDFEKK